MRAPNEFLAWLTAEMEEKGWGVRETARKAGVSHTSISNIINLGDRPSFDTCAGLAKAFGKPRETVLQLAGLLDKPGKASPLRDEWNHLFDKLGDSDQEELLALARMKTRRGEKRARAKTVPG